MKTGRTLTDLAIELERQQKTKKDFIAPSDKIEFEVNQIEVKDKPFFIPMLNMPGVGVYSLTDLAEEQLASRLGIPKKYYDKMKAEAPSLLATNANHWFCKGTDKYMVRTLDNKVRGFLSSRFRPLDNFDLAEVVLPELNKVGLNVVSCEVTDRRMYLKAVTDKITAEITKGDVVQAGIVVSNSEVGCGSVKIEPMIYRLVCSNGMISDDNSLRKYHVGRGDNEGDLREYFKTETRQADDKAFWMKVRDIVHSALGNGIFKNSVEKMKRAMGTIIDVEPSNIIEVVKNVKTTYGLADNEEKGILAHLLKGGDLSQYGLVNAVTRVSSDVDSYDRATELERLGGQILELTGKPWENLVKIAC